MGERIGRNIAHIATITSRAEALVIASALEHEEIPVWIDAVHHASVDPISIALGGHRLTVPSGDWERASDLIRELDLPGALPAYRGQQFAVMRLLAVYVGPHFFFGIPAFIAGLTPWPTLLALTMMPLGVPVDPRGQNDFYLAREAT